MDDIRGDGLSVRCWVVGAMLGCRCDVFAFNLRRSLCRPSKIVDRCVDLRRSMVDMSTFEDRLSMCRSGRPSMIDVKLCCYTRPANPEQ